MKTKIIKLYRSIIVSLLFVLFGVGAMFLRYLIFPFQNNKKQNYDALRASWEFFIKILEGLDIIKLNIKEVDKIKNIKNSIIVSTHPSFIDIIILMSIIPYSTCFVAEKLGKNPFLKWMVDYLFIINTNNYEEVMSKTYEKLKDGMNVIIFPMGSRHRKNEYPKIRRGAAHIAQNTHKNIELIHMETSFDFLQNSEPFYHAGEKHVVYTVEYLGKLKTEEYLLNYPDEVSFKTKITKDISKILYQIDKK